MFWSPSLVTTGVVLSATPRTAKATLTRKNAEQMRPVFREKEEPNDREKDQEHQASSQAEPVCIRRLLLVIHKPSLSHNQDCSWVLASIVPPGFTRFPSSFVPLLGNLAKTYWKSRRDTFVRQTSICRLTNRRALLGNGRQAKVYRKTASVR